MQGDNYPVRRGENPIEEVRELFRQLQPSVNMTMTEHFASSYPDSYLPSYIPNLR